MPGAASYEMSTLVSRELKPLFLRENHTPKDSANFVQSTISIGLDPLENIISVHVNITNYVRYSIVAIQYALQSQFILINSANHSLAINFAIVPPVVHLLLYRYCIYIVYLFTASDSVSYLLH